MALRFFPTLAVLSLGLTVASGSPAWADDEFGNDDEPGQCAAGFSPSAVTNRCIPDFDERLCPDGKMSIWNHCPLSEPCPDGGLSVDGECDDILDSEPAERERDE